MYQSVTTHQMDPIFTKIQSEKTDYLLRTLASQDSIEREKVYSIFTDKDEAIFICNYLSERGFLNMIGATYNDPFMLITPNDGISTFLKTGGFTEICLDREQKETKRKERESKEEQILDLDLKLKRFESRIGRKILLAGFIITVLSFLITILTLEFWNPD